jgi:GT2 family glycosyltransferase
MDRGGHVFVVIPVHDRIVYTRACLAALSVQSYEPLTVLVVDAGSSDGTAEHVAREFPEVVVVRAGKDQWWAGATNIGISWVLEKCLDEDYLLMLNNDTTVRSDYVSSLVQVARTESPAIVGSVCVDHRDGDTIQDGGPRLSWLSAKSVLENSGSSLSQCLVEGLVMTSPDLLSGRGTLVPIQCLRQIGLPNARWLPHYFADYEFTVRAKRHGYRLVMSYSSSVLSHVEASGLRPSSRRLSWEELFSVLVSRRSPLCLWYRWVFALLAAPVWAKVSFALLDTGRVVLGAVRNQLIGRKA